jgi:hypothetical protein
MANLESRLVHPKGKKVRECAQPVVPGQRVKVHCGRGARYGEVIGVCQDRRVLLSENKEFAALPLSQFHHVRDHYEVIFAQDQERIETVIKPVVVVDNPIAPTFEKLKQIRKRTKRRPLEHMAEEARNRIQKRRAKSIARGEKDIRKMEAKRQKLAQAIANASKRVAKWEEQISAIDKDLSTSNQVLKQLKIKYRWQK